jgi:hypothetical protein
MKTKLYPFYITTLLLLYAAFVNAQTVCNNELVLFRETFGNSTQTEEYVGERSGFKFMSGAQLESGEYVVLGNSQARPEWHRSTDHTGDANGQMMIINPGYSDADMYNDSVSGLTPGKYYSISLFAMNVNKAGTCFDPNVLPRIRIEIEYLEISMAYAELNSFTTNPIAVTTTPNWIKITCGFVLPSSVTEIRYRIINSAPADCGNSLAIDDISFSQCSSLSTLPVKGLKINSIEGTGSATRILFSTESETQTDRMITEKSTDGINWTAIHSQAAAGNSDNHRNYFAIDNSLSNQITWYRIKQTDLKGGESYSAILKYNPAALNTVSLTAYPTPFTSQLHLNFTSQKNETFTATLFSADGLTLQRIPVMARKGNNLVEFNTIHLKQGTYLVTVVNNDGSIRLTQKTVKQ